MRIENRKIKILDYPSSIVIYKGKSFNLGSGTDDRILKFREGDLSVILSENFRIGYASIKVIDWKTGEEWEQFFQNIDEVDIKYFDYSPAFRAKLLMQWYM
jgi:hypothetical protein